MQFEIKLFNVLAVPKSTDFVLQKLCYQYEDNFRKYGCNTYIVVIIRTKSLQWYCGSFSRGLVIFGWCVRFDI